MKPIWIWFVFLFIISVLLMLLLYPPHPRSWNKLRKGMMRSEVLNILNVSTLDLIDRNLTPPGAYEMWSKNYWAGRWTVKCIYYLEGRYLLVATVKYESYLFPKLFRMRHYD